MALTTEAKLRVARANNKALKKEIAGLHLYINMIQKQMGKDPIFKDASEPAGEDETCDHSYMDMPVCVHCGEPAPH